MVSNDICITLHIIGVIYIGLILILKYVRRNEMAVKGSYQVAGMKYQELALKRQDNENVRNYINETLTTI
jgi:hypothetical protein